jgi:2'-5' RNA ligase
MEQRWRLFVAIEIGPEAQQALRRAQDAARRAGFSARWVEPTNAHLTLKFLGDTDRTRVEALDAALRAVTANHTSFTLHTADFGAFPNLRRPSVLWLGLRGALERLGTLQQGVETALAAQGFPAEPRPFKPHLTLGRLGRGAAIPGPDAIAALIRGADFAGASLPVTQLQLVRSVLGSGGARYTTLAVFPLAAATD